MILSNKLEAKRIMLGTKEINRVMLGTNQIWPTGPWFCTDFTKGKMDGWENAYETQSFDNGLVFHNSTSSYSAIKKDINLSSQDSYSFELNAEISNLSGNYIIFTFGTEAFSDSYPPNSLYIAISNTNGMIEFGTYSESVVLPFPRPVSDISSIKIRAHKISGVVNVDVYLNNLFQSSILLDGDRIDFQIIGVSAIAELVLKNLCFESSEPFEAAKHEFRTFTSAGTHSQSIPSWATGFAYLMIGGGGGGGGGDGALGRHGNGGKRGQFQSGYQALGPGAVANVSVGAGGNAGAKENAGGPGGISTISNLGTGYGINLAASGGSGGSGYGGAAGEDTVAPRSYSNYLASLPNSTYLPYAGSAGNNTNGNAPGGGGGPGNGGIFGGGNPGRVGGRGEVHMMFYDQKFAQIYDLPIGTR